MSGNPLLQPPAAATEGEVLALHAEAIAVTKKLRRTLVRATRTTRTREVAVEENLAHEQVVVELVPIGRIVEAVPPIRQEGDVTILSVVEEEVVVQRRLVLREEVRFRRVHAVEHFTETVPLREQKIEVTRTELTD